MAHTCLGMVERGVLRSPAQVLVLQEASRMKAGQGDSKYCSN
ncbi:RING-type E3 ubiquitin transferase [Psidium guajava]|nr:RING-type E3 ubiquitin transferase [Psidium guajava]